MRTGRVLLASMLATLLLATSAGIPAAEDPDALVFIRATYKNRAQLQSMASRFQHLIVDEKTRTVRVEASYDDIAALRRMGVKVDIDDASTTRMRAADAAMQTDITTQAITGYPCYRTVEETYATMDVLAATHPNLARVVDIGPSWVRTRNAAAGYRLRALRLTNAATDAVLPNKPNMVVVASIHAREYTPAELLTRFGEWLVDGYGRDAEATWLMDNFRFHLVMQGNPDGRKRAESGLSWRKNVNNTNGVCSANSYGIDLNRNFPYRWNGTPGGSSGDACASTYRGPSVASEPETIDLLRYVAGVPNSSGVYVGGVLPDRRADAPTSPAPIDYRGLFLDLHSYSQLVLWPWSYKTEAPPNSTALRTLGRRLAFFNGYSPRQWTGLYIADGTTTDSMYGLLGAPSYTIEFGVSFFESCSTFESSTLPRNINAVRYAARALNAPYTSPGGPDTTAVTLSPARVAAGTVVAVNATVDDSPFNQTNGTEPVQAIASARAYINRAPWIAGANPIPMIATDRSFNSSRENVAVNLGTASLAIGKYTIYVVGTDASGRTGTPRAATLTIAGSRAFANATDIAIPDGGAGTSAIVTSGISGTGSSALRLDIDIRHPNIGDLVVDLIGPGGTLYRLHNRTGGTTDNIFRAYIADTSSESANGTWRLRVTDQVAGNRGYINRWSMLMQY